jgi:ethanolamine kinase
LRAYGNDSDILIDRDMEATTHTLLAERGLAAPLLARFKNGLLYKFMPGRVCTPQDLIKEPVWRAVAAQLGEWHARLPLPSPKTGKAYEEGDVMQTGRDWTIASPPPSRSIWTVLQEWVAALPSGTKEAEIRKNLLQKELDKSFLELVQNGGGHPGNVSIIFSTSRSFWIIE